MNIAIIGQGAREVAIARALSRSQTTPTLINIATYINPDLAQCASIQLVKDFKDCTPILKALADKDIEFAIIGPELPLAAGLGDLLMSDGIACIGPQKRFARIETSKSYCRNLLTPHAPEFLPLHRSFHTTEGLSEFIDELHDQCVIKADGLMGGKGVFVSGEHFQSSNEAHEIAETLLQKGKIVVEEKLVGQEFSLMSFSDGKTLKHMPIVKDFKRVFEGNLGPNTGGMGCISFADHKLPFLTEKDVLDAQHLNQLTIELLNQDNNGTYCGILYGGYMMTENGIKLIEFNARFGDPEAMSVLALLETDFVHICQSMVDGSLADVDIRYIEKATVCKYLVPNGYPDAPSLGVVDFSQGNDLYCASVKKQDNVYRLLGSRAVACLGVAYELAAAENLAEREAKLVVGDVFYRNDIGRSSSIASNQKELV